MCKHEDVEKPHDGWFQRGKVCNKCHKEEMDIKERAIFKSLLEDGEIKMVQVNIN